MEDFDVNWKGSFSAGRWDSAGLHTGHVVVTGQDWLLSGAFCCQRGQ